jgi:hypothetical protein
MKEYGVLFINVAFMAIVASLAIRLFAANVPAIASEAGLR